MKIVYFTHSLLSCWNHGNAHFLRGVLRELVVRGHDVHAFERDGAWSLANLLADHGPEGLVAFRNAYPELSSRAFAPDASLQPMLEAADLVIVHEWNEPELIAAIGRERARGAQFTLLFHDTHHRAVSDPAAIRAFDLSGYDGVLAFGETLAEVYRRWGWGDQVFLWHEAADIRHFRPPLETKERSGLVWIGNWGDGERAEELEEFLLRPAWNANLSLDIHGVRYPAEALAMLERYGARYRGWLANARVPDSFSRYLATVHVPRRFYSAILPGIPTIRMFEAMACGIPLVSAPWEDSEGLFRAGEDYLTAADGVQMEQQLKRLKFEPALRRSLVEKGLETIRARHTCSHRADELLIIADRLRAPTLRSVA